jgi:hypothetical protein
MARRSTPDRAGRPADYDVSKDWKRFILDLPVGDPQSMTAVLNWMNVLP